MVQNEVRLEGVRVTADDLLGPPGEGMAAATDTMEFGRFCMSALGLGVMKRCLQLMVRHAGRRRIATGRLLENPVTLVRLSELTAAAAAVESLMSVVAGCLDGGRPVPAEVYCACKVAGPELAWRAADDLMQQLGGRGYIETNLAPQILRDTRIMRIFEGPTEPMTMHIGSRLVHDPADVRRFLSEELGQPELAAELIAAADRIRDRCARPGGRRWGDAAAKRWSYMLAGEVGVYGLLLGSIVASSRGGGPWARAAEWARRRLDGCLAEALASSAAESVLLDAGALEELVSRYTDSIGDVEQWRAGEQQGVDELLRRDETAGLAAEPAPDSAACGCGPGVAVATAVAAAPAAAVAGATIGTGPDLVAWLMNWVSTTFDRPESGIRPGDRFSEYGMDSVTALMLTNSLESWLNIDLPPTVMWDHPTIEDLAGYLSGIYRPASESVVGSAVSSPDPSAAGITGPLGDEMHLLARVDNLPEEQLRALLERLTTDEMRE